MSSHDLLGPTLVTVGAAIILTLVVAYAVMRLMPNLRFKEDEPLPSYTGLWAQLIPVAALVPAGASVTLVITRDITFLWLLPLALMSALIAALTMTDLKFHRLPNGVMAVLYISMLVTFPVPVILAQDWDAFARFGIGFGITLVGCILLRLFGMGGGDLKVIPIIFATLSAISWETSGVWLFVGWISCGVWAMGQGIALRSLKGGMPMMPGLTMGFALLPFIMMLEPLSLFEGLLMI